MIFEDGPPGRGILSLLKKGELKDDNIDPINLEGNFFFFFFSDVDLGLIYSFSSLNFILFLI